MKRLIALLMMALLAAALLCACTEADQEPTGISDKYPGTYIFHNNTIRERTTRTLIIHENGTYDYIRVSTLAGVSASFTGTWTVNENEHILLKADGSGLVSDGMLSEDTMLLNVLDLENGDDTVGDGIYWYQIPEQNEATPDAG